MTDTTSENNTINTQPPASTSSREDLRLLSVNEAREILKIRHKTVKKFIEDGKIEVIIIGKRIKIPMKSLEKFIEEHARVITDEQKEERLTTSRGYINEHVDSIIKKHTRRK